MKTKLSLRSFRSKYGTHVQCLEAVKQMQFPEPHACPKCKTVQKFYPVTNRTAYACNSCGHHIYPLAGTIFEKSTTPLDLWFFAMYLMAQTRSGTSAKQLERMLGVTYKTAWRMFKQIRMLMAEGGLPLDGDVEIDETFIGGKGMNRAYKPHFNLKQKEIVMGMIQRDGKAYFKHIESTGKWAILKQVQTHISPTARVLTDEMPSYIQLTKHGYGHETVKHKSKEYVRGDVHTQNVDSFWSGLKRGIYGVYRKVSKKYLQAYVDEYGFRYNNRKQSEMMFDLLLERVTSVSSLKASQLK